jgi:hypothetical protein
MQHAVALAYVRRVWPPSATVIDFDVAECGPTEANIAETFVFSTTKKQDSLAAVESFLRVARGFPSYRLRPKFIGQILDGPVTA